MAVRRLMLAGLMSLCAMVVGLLFASVPALAASEEHPYLSSQSLLGNQFADGGACGVVTDSSGDVYVGDYNNGSKGKVEVFSSAGSKITEFKAPTISDDGPCSLAVDSTGDVYVEMYNSEVVKYKPTAFPPVAGTTYALEESAGTSGVIVKTSGHAHAIAVDPANQDLYVAEASHVSSFEPNGKLISEKIGEGLVSDPNYYGLDVYGSNGDVYVTDTNDARAYILNPEGNAILKEIDGAGSPTGVFGAGLTVPNLAVDQSDGDVYVFVGGSNAEVVYEFNSSGGYLSAIGPEFGSSLHLQEVNPSDVAVDNGSSNEGDVYVTSKDGTAGDNVYAFGPLAAVTEYELKVKTTGGGTGIVTCEVEGSGKVEEPCASTSKYAAGTKLVLKEKPGLESTFAGWSEACSSAGDLPECKLEMSASESVTAEFTKALATKDTLTITKSGTGKVECEVNSSGTFVPCVAEYNEGTKLVLKETPEDSATFAGWSAGSGSATVCSGTSTSTCSFTITANSAITATWNPAVVTKDKLTVTKDGTGKVECEVEGGAPGTCATEYAEGTKLVLKETAEGGSTFTEWSAGTGSASVCSTVKTSTCSFTITADSAITATWTPPVVTKDTLTITKNGTGKVECEVNSSGTFGSCATEYAEGTKLVLKETPESGSTFTEWSSGTGSASVCSTVKTSTCSFTIAADSAITATWTAPPAKDKLTITKSGTGKVECEVNSSGTFVPCVAEYNEGTKLVLKETAEDSATFTGWSAGSGSASVCSATSTSTCSFTIAANSAVTATWTPSPAKDTLTITKSGTGKVECEANSSGTFGSCATEYAEGTKLVLKETPEGGSTFTEWSAGTGSASVCSTVKTSTCSFTITANSAVTSTWAPPVVKDKLTITKDGTGKVECEVEGGTPGTCATEYAEGTKLVLTETAEDGATFAGWSSGSGSASACSGTSTSTCSFTIAADSAIAATWNPAVVTKDTLTVTKTGAGTGKVECEVNGSGHFEGCATEYPEGTKLVLRGLAESGSEFAGWSGGSGSASACTGAGNCSVTITANSALTATFNLTIIAKEGRLTVSGQASVSGEDALLKLSCSTAGACAGNLELTIEVRQGRRTRTVVVGQASYSLAAGQSETLKVRLSGFALGLVERFRTLDAKLTGPGGLNQAVKLQVQRHHGHHRKHGLSGYGQVGKRAR